MWFAHFFLLTFSNIENIIKEKGYSIFEDRNRGGARDAEGKV